MKKTSKNAPKREKGILRKKEPSGPGSKKKSPSGMKRILARKEDRVPPRKVEFHFSGIEAGEVFLSGDFNSWDFHSLPLKKKPRRRLGRRGPPGPRAL
jgi:hypothetical protein